MAIVKQHELEAFIASQKIRHHLERIRELRAQGHDLDEARRIAEDEHGVTVPIESPELEIPTPEDGEHLATQIREAFRNVTLGSGTSLHQAGAMDNYEPPEIVARARQEDAEEDWQSITDEKVERFAIALPFMDAEGYRFHLPRFMLWSLAHRDERRFDFAVNAAAYSLHCPEMHRHPGVRENCLLRWSLLTEAQRAVVASFLTFIVRFGRPFDTYVAAQALLLDWNTDVEA